MNKFKKFVCAALVVAVSVCAVPVYHAEAASISQLQQKRQNLASSTKKAKQEIENIKSKKLSAEQEMAAMDKVLTSIQAELDEATEDLNILIKQLEEAKKALQEATEKRDAQFELLGSRMRFLQQKGSSGYLEILFDAQSFSDLFLRMQYVNDIMGYDKEILQELEKIQKTIEKKKKEIEKNKTEQEEVVKLQKEKLAEQQEIVNEKKALVASYQKDLSKYEQMVAANEKADREVLNQIARQQSQSSSSTVYYTGNGSLGWPVPGRTYVSSGFVTRTSPITGKRESHSGLDIPAAYGAAIVAAEAGKVTYSGWMNGYGNTIIIDHGGGLSTLYGHNSSLVAKVGQVVSRGQTVAKCGSTGWSTGNHCHFSVLKNGAYVNPNNYL